MNNTEKSPDQRPLSPHLQIYRPTISMVMSVMHRLTGLSLYFGVSFLIIWFVALILGPESYEKFNLLLSMQFVQIIFFLVTWAFFHHLLQRGIYWPPSKYEAAFLSWQHSDAILSETIEHIRAWI